MRPKNSTNRRDARLRFALSVAAVVSLSLNLPFFALAEDKPPATEFEKALAAITDAKPIIHQLSLIHI